MVNTARIRLRAGLAHILLICLLSMPSAYAHTPQEAPPASIDNLSWLAGHWFGQHRDVRMEELWLPPDGGVMLGLHRDVADSHRVSFEFLRITTEEGKLIYYASPGGRPPVPFRLKELAERWVVFENPENDYPQRIIYLREGKQLHARIEGEVEGKLRSQSWVWYGK